ncbi:MAG: MBL fold metallo-hydrolase [Candidatus Eisenbacteria bacterium]|nr:MBL fold metallo-hydrolase [Candidatus Eisenbacteria bacterium]
MKEILLKKIVVGNFETNCYVVGCAITREGLVVDPGADADAILQAIEDMNLKIVAIVNTHGHADHIAANQDIKSATGAELLIHERDSRMLEDAVMNLSAMFSSPVLSPPADRFLKEGDAVKVGSILLDVIHTPGHTEGGISLAGQGFVFSGDTLFAGSVGRTDFPGGSFNLLVESIRVKLMCLPPTTTVFSGHGSNTTIGDERKNNPFL